MDNIWFRIRPAFRRLALWIGIAMAILAPLAWLQTGTASAHAVLERSVPEPGERMEEGPAAVELHFNEAVESDVGSIAVLDDRSNPVTEARPEAPGDRKSLRLPLPELKEGRYTVSYKVVSADGHPVSGSYVFVVGNPPASPDASAFDLHKQVGHEGHGGYGAEKQLTVEQFIMYTIRVLYYAALLLAAGIMLWYALSKGRQPALEPWLAKWGLYGMRALLTGTLLYVFMSTRELMEGLPLADWGSLLLSTSVGQIWLSLLLLAAVGFAVMKAGRIAALLWTAALLAVESLNGHAAAMEPKAMTVAADFVHLLAAAVWVGGLTLLLALWFGDRKEAGRFAPAFSNAAWLSVALLALSGIGLTVYFMPGWDYLFYTPWGTLLLIKSALVLLVMIVGVLLRLRVRKGHFPKGTLLKMDGILMALIIVIAAIFTSISPLPENEPVNWHQMGEEMHVTVRISPNVPGDNKFTVKVWLPEDVGTPKSVALRLLSEDRPESGPIDIPLEPYEDDEFDAFDGFVKATYRSEGPYLPYAGRWIAEVRVLDRDDNERVERHPFRNY